MSANYPFFIVGCVRSGTTMLRKLLTEHPRLESPEETNFFRWADPFGTQRYRVPYTQNKILLEHQSIDGFSREEFVGIYESSFSRKELMDNYMESYLKKKGNSMGRWFDKTPQHIYGVILLKDAYPDARFIHIVRNPLNVAASLVKGVVMPKQTIVGAVNYWNESYSLVKTYKKLLGDNLFEIKYEDFTSSPHDSMRDILNFIEEDDSMYDYSLLSVYQERNEYKEMLSDEDVLFIKEKCKEGRSGYGY